jgi:hypothetical protein
MQFLFSASIQTKIKTKTKKTTTKKQKKKNKKNPTKNHTHTRLQQRTIVTLFRTMVGKNTGRAGPSHVREPNFSVFFVNNFFVCFETS